MSQHHQSDHKITPTRMVGALVLAIVFLAGMAAGAWAGAVTDANAGRGGESLDINSLATKGKTTLIDVYSPFCPPCVRLAPLLEQLAAKRPDLAIKKVSINRPGVQGIDWASPLAKQYQIRSVPHFMVFNPKGKLVAQGRDGFEQVKRWLQEAGLLKQ
jgi:thiol-disulfide isomerase/thioredoxin